MRRIRSTAVRCPWCSVDNGKGWVSDGLLSDGESKTSASGVIRLSLSARLHFILTLLSEGTIELFGTVIIIIIIGTLLTNVAVVVVVVHLLL